MAYTPKNFDQIVADIIAYVVANSPQISDITPGSVMRSIAEGAALAIEEIHVSSYLGFRRYLKTIAPDIFEFERKTGTRSSTNVVFSRTGSSGTATVPEGTEIQTGTGLSFFTSSQVQITSGNTDSDPVEVIAEEPGVAYNVNAATISVIADDLEGVDTVSNASAAVGGVDQESDFEYNKRFQSYIEGLARANIAGLISGALSVEGVTSASVVELFPPATVGGSPNVNAALYIDDGSVGGVSVDTVNAVQLIIDGDGTAENPGYRAAGVNVKVLGPGIITVPVTVNIEPISGVDTSQILSDLNLGVTNYINTQPVGVDILRSEIIAAIMDVFGVYNVELVDPAADETIAGNEVGRVGAIVVNFV